MKSMKPLMWFTLLMILAGGAVSADAPSLPRYPAPSPDGSHVAFSWQGDLWIVPAAGGEARRITVHPGYDGHPVWRGDGSEMTFSSDRTGGGDLYRVPVGGGPPTRLTHHARSDTPLGYSPDGTRILFLSRRGLSPKRGGNFYFVPAEGGTPSLVTEVLGADGAWSPDGSILAYVRGGTKASRRSYRGSANREIWIRDLEEGTDRQITYWEGDDDHPMWSGGGTLVFRSMRSGVKNLWKADLHGGVAVQVTHFAADDIRSPSISADGRWVAFEREMSMFLLDLQGGGEAREIAVLVPGDRREDVEVLVTKSSDAGEMAISPDGKQAAFVVHGDLFVSQIREKDAADVAKGPTVRVTRTPEQESDISWAPDGKSLLFTTERSGIEELYRARPENDEDRFYRATAFVEEKLGRETVPCSLARYSPNGGRIAFVRGLGDLVVSDSEGNAPVVLVEGFEPPDFRWSPDGRWIAYAAPDLHYNYDIWVVPAEGGEAFNVSRSPTDDVGPAWSGDGRVLAWSSARHSLTRDVWFVFLRLDDHLRSESEWVDYWEDEDLAGEDDAKKEDSDDESAPPEVIIDFDRIWRRVRSLTSLPGDETQVLISDDHRTFFFSSDHEEERDLYKIRWDGEELERLTEGGKNPTDLAISKDGKKLFCLAKNGKAMSLPSEGGKSESIPYSARYRLRPDEERRAVFDQAWRQLDRWFYDPGFHGADWAAVGEKYRRMADSASCRSDFDDVVNWMLGELNSSHQGFYGPRGDSRPATGETGLFFDVSAGGPGLLIAQVLPDTPASHPDVALEAGDRLLSVDSENVDEGVNVYGFFGDTVDREVRLLVLDAGSGEKRWVVLRPVSFGTLMDRRYDAWVKERRAIVDRLSQGRFGYMHLRYMAQGSLEDFMVELESEGNGREGLIIDVRSNGGGWTTDWMMAILTVRRHAYTIPRGASQDVRAYPDGERLILPAWTKPAATLCDEASYSNAEIFSHAFQTLERGPLVGNLTFGAVISTGAARLLDGSRVRLPLRGWYNARTERNMEFYGAAPDIVVLRPPQEDMAKDIDSQLAAAVDALQTEVEGLDGRIIW